MTPPRSDVPPGRDRHDVRSPLTGQFVSSAATPSSLRQPSRRMYPGIQAFHSLHADMNQERWPDARLLPQLRRTLDATPRPNNGQRPGRTRSGIIEERLWRNYHGDPPQYDLETALNRVLDALGAVLQEWTRMNYDVNPPTMMAPPRRAFFHPLLLSLASLPPTSPEEVQCMPFDPTLVATSGNFLDVDGSQYMNATLAYDGRQDSELAGEARGNIREGAHRLVLWAFFGPPDADMIDPVVMHYCKGQRGCLNPLHLCWGPSWENTEDAKRAGPAQHARRRIRARFAAQRQL
jgi:hypothetical protein